MTTQDKKSRLLLKNVLIKPKGSSGIFHEATSIKRFSGEDMPYEDWPDSWRKIHYKEYPRFKVVPFEKDLPTIKESLTSVMARRISQRDFTESCGLKCIDIQKILYFSAGINSLNKSTGSTNRYVPSAGARYPLECYILNRNTVGLERASYHFNVKRNYLERMFAINEPGGLFVDATNQKWTLLAGCLLIVSAVFDRTKIKYGDRGYRYALIEAGHLAQNILLTSTALNIKACSVGGFKERKLNDALDLDGVMESVIYVIALGK